MGIFDRFRSARQINTNGNELKVDTSAQDATRLIEKGHVFEANGQFDKAMQSYREAIQFAPNSARAYLNLGNALLLKGDLPSALDAFRVAIKHKPDYAGAYYNMGNALLSNKQFGEAAENYRKALEIQHDYAEVHCALGIALKEIGQLDSALASFQKALRINSNLAEAHLNLGVTLKELGQVKEATASFRHSLKINPDFAEAHNNLGNALKDLGQLDSAILCFQKALEINPGLVEAHSNMGNALQDIGQIDKSVVSHHRALAIKPDSTEAHSNLLFSLNYTSNHAPAYYLEQARQFGLTATSKVNARYSAWRCEAKPNRLRVGLVSGDLRKHSVGYFLEGLIAHIDPGRIELIAYSTHHKGDDLTARIRPGFSAWKSLIGKNDVSTAQEIHADGVHVLIDLSVHTARNRLPVFAWKPAPIQVSWLGLPATTGMAEMDYVLGDPYAIPAEFESHFSETVWRMPESCLCLTVPVSPVTVAPLPALSKGYVTFGSFNNLAKMTDDVVAVWARVLKAVPNSRLYLKTRLLNDSDVVEKTRQRFAACGIAANQLLLAETFASREDHLAEYNKVDIALDTFPYPGVTTSIEALWMSVPVLSMRGDRFLTRTAESIAINAGLPDWIATDDDYVDKAVAFASDLKHLAMLRSGLRQQVLESPLFDAPRFARNFENALWGMWRHYQDKQENSQ